jgi:hypothetical protein
VRPKICPLPHPFDSTAALGEGFADGLAAMLESHQGLGVYILVLANAAYERRLWNQLAPALSARHAELAAAMTEALRRGQNLNEPDDDVGVFLKLNTIGFDHLGIMESRRVGPWETMYNPIRALRPPRISGMKFESLQRDFDPAGFHFNKPFLAREIFWEGMLAGKPARMLYNKFPFARLHGLLVPEPLREMAQHLTPELHGWAWDICAQSGVQGFCLGYNSHGAGASVNHLHFQSFVLASPLPVQDGRFDHNNGDQPYPLPCRRFNDAETAWFELDRLHQHNMPYNLVYSQGCLHLIARVPQDSGKLNDTCRGYGWSEMAGAVTLFSREAFESLSEAEFEGKLMTFMPGPGA